jgi:hypothetical protein
MQSAFAILSSVACYALQYSSTLSHTWQELKHKKKRKNGIEHETRVLIFSTTFG